MLARGARCLVVVILAFCGAPVAFSKEAIPEAAVATKVAAAWLRAVADARPPEAVRISAYPFGALGFEGPKCKGDKTARGESDLVGIIRCVADELVTEETKPDVGKEDLAVLDEKTLRRAGWKQQRKYLRGRMREERLVWRLYPDEDILRIVVLGVRMTSEGPRVTSLTYHTDMLADE